MAKSRSMKELFDKLLVIQYVKVCKIAQSLFFDTISQINDLDS